MATEMVENPVPACEGEEPLPDRKAAKFQRGLIQEYPDVFQSKLTSTLKPIDQDDIVHVIKLKDPANERPSKGFYPVPHSIYERAQAVVMGRVRKGRLVPSNAPTAAPVFFKDKKIDRTTPHAV